MFAWRVALAGDTLIWASGAATEEKGHVLWAFDAISQKSKYLHRGFLPSDCEHDRVVANGSSWSVQLIGPRNGPIAIGRCSAHAPVVIADAAKWMDPAVLLTSQGKDQPVACGAVDLVSTPEVYWTFLAPAAKGKNHRPRSSRLACGGSRQSKTKWS